MKILKHINWPIVLLILIVIWGAFLRLYHIGDQSLWIDESYSALAIQNIVETGIPQFESGVLYLRGLTHTYLAAGFQELFGKEAGILRLPAALFGIATILLAYFSGIVFFKKKSIGLIAAAIVAFGYFEIAWSRQIRMYTEFQFLFLLSITLFYQFIQAKIISFWKWIAFFLITLLTVATHLLGVFLVPAYLIIALHEKYKKKYLLLAFVMLITFFVLLFDWPSFMVTVKETFTEIHVYLPNYSAFLSSYYTFVLLAVIIGLFYAVGLKNRSVGLLGIIFFSILLLISFSNQISMRYIFFIMPLLFLLAAFGINAFLTTKKTYWRPLALIVIFFLAMQSSFAFLPRADYFLEFDPLSQNPKLDYTPQPDFKEAYKFLERQIKEDDIFIVAHTGIHKWYMPDTQFYWLGFHFANNFSTPNYAAVEYEGYFLDRYTGVGIIDDLEILNDLMEKKHGYIIWDFFAIDNRLDNDLKQLVIENAELVFHHQAHEPLPWTQMWIYKF